MLRPELAVLLDAARSEAKSHDTELNLLHLSAAVARRWPREYGTVFGEAKAAKVASGLAQRAEVGDAASVESLLNSANGPDPISRLVHGLVKELEVWLDSPAEGTSPGDTPAAPIEGEAHSQSVGAEASETGSPFELPGRSARFLELIAGDLGVQGREAVVDELLTILGRRAPLAALIVGESGAGRTAFLSAFAARIADSGYAGPLAGVPVVRVLPGAVIGADRANALRRIIEDFDDPVVLAVDDIDVIAGMGGAYADGDLLNVLRSAVEDAQIHLVLTIDSRFASRLGVANHELADELVAVDLPALPRAVIEDIARQAASELAEFHTVEVADEIALAACGDPPTGAPRVHPGLLMDRLDGACVRASLRADRRVTLDDLRLGGGSRNVLTDATALADRLGGRVLGQSDALHRLARRITLTRAQLDLRPARPDGVFLLVGPTGVGKTELALALCDEVFGDERRLIRLDMSEYAHDWALSRLIGPQPGFVGFTEPESWLTTRIAKEPSTVLLLDEVEKAHPTIWNAFLQVFDAGRLSDARGTVADFSSTVVVMTSNMGADRLGKTAVGFGTRSGSEEDEREVWESVRQTMPPELINRIDEVVVFQSLAMDAIHQIAAKEVDQAVDRLLAAGYQIQIDESVIGLLATSGYDPAFGARHLQRNIERLLLQPLTEQTTRSLRATAVNQTIEWSPLDR